MTTIRTAAVTLLALGSLSAIDVEYHEARRKQPIPRTAACQDLIAILSN